MDYLQEDSPMIEIDLSVRNTGSQSNKIKTNAQIKPIRYTIP
jgi:hypothetical protein